MRPLILASSSPRRRHLLSKINDNFLVLCPNFSEERIQTSNPDLFVMVAAFQKAQSIYKENQESLVIGCDTLVAIEGEIIGKPHTRQEAKESLLKLSGKKHIVLSGICLLSRELKVVERVVSEVHFKDLTPKEIETYLNTGEYKDKAGAYGIQGYGKNLVEKYVGSLDNIIGLPVEEIKEILDRV